MILGIIASEDVVPAAETLPARANLDFGAGSYVVDGDTLALADVVDHPENVTPGFGVILGFEHAVEIFGALADLMLTANVTIVAEWYRVYNFATPFAIGNDDDPLVWIEDGAGGFYAFDAFHFPERNLTVPDAAGIGENGVLHGAALMRTDDRFAISVDQGSVVSDSTFSAAAGQTRVFIGGHGNSYGAIVLRRLKVYDPLADEVLPTLSATSGAFPVAPNDDFAHALPIEVDQVVYGLNTGCTRQAGEPDHAGNTSGGSMWRKFTAPASGDYTAIVWQSTILDNPVTAIYTGASVGALSEVASDLAVEWEITFTAVEGTDYYIAQEGLDGEEGFFSLSVVAA